MLRFLYNLFFGKKCTFCKKRIQDKDYMECDMDYSYDVRGTTKCGKHKKNCHKKCWKTHWKEASKFWDDVDEVMNRNIYFQREKGMIGKYKDGDKEFGPVYAYWKRTNIEGTFIQPLGEENEALINFKQWLKENNLSYKYQSRG